MVYIRGRKRQTKLAYFADVFEKGQHFGTLGGNERRRDHWQKSLGILAVARERCTFADLSGTRN